MPGAPRGSLPCLAPGRGVTFFETQTKLLQPAPDGYLTHSYPGLMVEPVLQLRQGRIGFRGNPGQQQLPLSFVHRRLPTGSMHRSFHQPRPPVRCRNLLGPTHTHMEIFSQLFQGSVTVLIGGQKFAAQIILVCLCHTLGSRRIAKYSLHYLLKCFSHGSFLNLFSRRR